MQPKTGFASVPSSSRLLPFQKKLKIERRQKAKLREKQCAYFHDSCSRCHFDSPETARCFIFGAEGNISARAEVSHVIATKFQPGQPG